MNYKSFVLQMYLQIPIQIPEYLRAYPNNKRVKTAKSIELVMVFKNLTT